MRRFAHLVKLFFFPASFCNTLFCVAVCGEANYSKA
jgi:hypothetical protein